MIFKRHICATALLERDPVGQTHPGTQHLPGLDVLSRQVQASDGTAVLPGCETRCSADPTTHIKNVIVFTKFELVQKFTCSLAATDMKLVHRTQVFQSDGLRRLAE